MQTHPLEQRTQNLERRVDRIETVLPTLATREELKTTERRMRSHVTDAIKGSKQRMCTHFVEAIEGWEQRICKHFDVVAESLRDEIRLLAEAVATLSERKR